MLDGDSNAIGYCSHCTVSVSVSVSVNSPSDPITFQVRNVVTPIVYLIYNDVAN